MAEDSRTRRRRKKKERVWPYILLALFGLCALVAATLFTLDIGADVIAGVASRNAREHGMVLSVENAAGNPFKGYVFSGVKLSSQKGEPIFSAADLSGTLNLASIFRAIPILASGGDFSSVLSSNFPLDKISTTGARFASLWGAVDAKSAAASFAALEQGGFRLKLDFACDLASNIGALPLTGKLDIDVPTVAELGSVEINRGDITLGKGGLAIVGTLNLGSSPPRFDIQASARAIDLSELLALFSQNLPENFKPSDYDGKTDADFSIDGSLGDLTATGSVDFKGGKLNGYPVSSLSARVRYAASRLSVDNLKTALFGVPLEGSFSAEPKTGDFAFKLDGANAPLSELAKLYPALGKVSGNIKKFALSLGVTGGVPSGAVELSSPLVSALGKSVENVALQIKLDKNGVASVSGKFVFEGSQAFVQGTVPSVLSSPTLDLTANLKDLDARKIADFIPGGKNYALSGSVAANFAIKGKFDNPTVSGQLTAPVFAAFGYTFSSPGMSFEWKNSAISGVFRTTFTNFSGLKLSNISVPFAYSGNAVKSSNGSLTLYGGKLVNNFNINLDSMKWSDSFTATNFDINPLVQDVSGSLDGKITGRGNLSLNLGGSADATPTYSGKGTFTATDGVISGFAGLTTVAKLYKVDGIRYVKVNAPLSIETGALTIAKGSSATPPDNDPLYKSAVLTRDGTVTLDDAAKLDFDADINVNLQLLNALTGGAAGGIEALDKGGNVLGNLEDALKGALGAVVKQGSNADFRVASVRIGGTKDKPSVRVLKIGQSTESAKPSGPAAQPVQPLLPSQPAQRPVNEGEKQPDKIKEAQEKVEKEVLRGIDNLLNRKKR
ncbi:hypothetical protein AGMMS49957_10020 [Synergistales bacterium]|nr:hypothetical protein AGMMS49957_10020 [Synergistales bacterium]